MFKKLFLLTFAAGVLVGITTADCSLILLYPLVFGGIYSLVFWFILRLINKFSGQKYKNRINKAVTAVCPILFITLSWYIIYPPAKTLFKRFVINPIPNSVFDIKSRIEHGPFGDTNCNLMFHINESDLDKIVKSKAYEPAKNPQLENGDLSWKHGNGSHSISLPDYIPWFKISDIKNSVVYVKQGEGRTEYIIYDKLKGIAYYNFFKY